MKSVKWLISAGIFILLTTLRLFVPGADAAISDGADRLLNRDVDYAQLLSSLEYKNSGVENPSKTLEKQLEDNRNFVSYTGGIEPLCVDGSRIDICKIRAVSAVEEDSSQQKQEDEKPAAVQAFLDSQAEFSALALPANADYDFYELPFEYSAPVSGSNSSGFGFRMHPIYNEVKFHYGTDYAANTGENICAFASGTVSFAGYSESYGNFITIDHENGWQSLYAHCSRLDVKTGDKVEKNQLIAAVGATGNVTGPHLHFELTHNGIYVNPEYYVNL